MNTYRRVKESDNSKVLAMLSGGKDSVTAVIMLKKQKIEVTAIHFIHNWGSSIPTTEAKRICKEYDIPLIIVDFTEEFCSAVNGYTDGRPCLICKKEMYKLLLEHLESGMYGWLCIGDNANDRTTIARIHQYINNGNQDDTLMCSGYFGSEMGVSLPKGIKVIRPLINMSATEVEGFLSNENVLIQRINSTGDKYFEYHREGCPVQFADIGVSLDEELYSDLKKYNDVITEYARKKGILASVHMPSTFIITIPRGYEDEAANYLESCGLPVNTFVNSKESLYDKTMYAVVFDINISLYETQAYKKIFTRILERLELYGENIEIIDNYESVICKYETDGVHFEVLFNFKCLNANITYSFNHTSPGRKEIDVFDNLILEMFRTRKYKVHEY